MHIMHTRKLGFLAQSKRQWRAVQGREVNKNDRASIFEGRNTDRSHALAVTPCVSVEMVTLKRTSTDAIRGERY